MQHKLTAEQVEAIRRVNSDILQPGTLVVYRGGGYDGCFWEFNTFLVTADDEITNIHSSGRQGVWSHGFSWQGRRKPEFDFDNLLKAVEDPDMAANLETQEGRREINGFIGCYALAVARKFEELDLGFSVELKCCECGEYFDCTEEFLLDHGYDRGDGGVGIVNDHLVCSSCYYSTVCTGCGERYEEGEELSTANGSYCAWCVKQARKKFSEEEEELYEQLDTDILQITIDSRRLGELRPENKEVYAKQANELIGKLQVEMAKMVEEYL